MTTEQLIAVMGGLTALLTAIGVLIGQVAALRHAVDGVTTELVAAREVAAEKEGELRGRDYVSRPDPLGPPSIPS